MSFDYSYVLPPTGPAENAQVREMFDDVRDYVNTLISGGGSGAPDSSQYVTLATDANLSNERVLTAGSGISLTDNGAGSTVVVANTGVRSISTTNVNFNFSGSTGAVTFTFSTTPTFSSLIFQSATGAIGLTPSASVFTSYNLTFPLNTGTSGYLLSTDGATPTATLSWVAPTTVKAITGTTNQISVDNSGDPIVLSTPQDIATGSSPTFLKLTLGAGTSSDPALSIGDVNTGFYEAAGGDGFINLVLDGTIATVWTPSDQMLANTGPVKALNFKFRNATSGIVTVQAQASSFTDYTLTLPADDGTPNQVLQTNGSGVLSWVTQSGSGTVNSGTANCLAYYPASSAAVDDLTAITASRALVSDANGLPVAATTTATEIGYVNGVTSAIQTQFTGKLSTTGGTMSGDIAMGTNKLTGLAAGTAAGHSVRFEQNKVIQVVTATSETTFTTTSSTYQTTNCSATITPTSSSNIILIFAMGYMQNTDINATNATGAIFRDSTIITSGTTITQQRLSNVSTTTGSLRTPCSFTAKDAPASTSAITYSVKIASSNNSTTVGFNPTGGQTTMILMEVAP